MGLNITFSITETKHLSKATEGKEVLFWLTVPGKAQHEGRKPWKQELEAASHTASRPKPGERYHPFKGDLIKPDTCLVGVGDLDPFMLILTVQVLCHVRFCASTCFRSPLHSGLLPIPDALMSLKNEKNRNPVFTASHSIHAVAVGPHHLFGGSPSCGSSPCCQLYGWCFVTPAEDFGSRNQDHSTRTT